VLCLVKETTPSTEVDQTPMETTTTSTTTTTNTPAALGDQVAASSTTPAATINGTNENAVATTVVSEPTATNPTIV